MCESNKKEQKFQAITSGRKLGAARKLDYKALLEEYRGFIEAGSRPTALQEYLAKKYNVTPQAIRRAIKIQATS